MIRGLEIPLFAFFWKDKQLSFSLIWIIFKCNTKIPATKKNGDY